MSCRWARTHSVLFWSRAATDDARDPLRLYYVQGFRTGAGNWNAQSLVVSFGGCVLKEPGRHSPRGPDAVSFLFEGDMTEDVAGWFEDYGNAHKP